MTLTADFVTNKTLPFNRMRALLGESMIQEGVLDALDYKVSQRAAGANMSVDVAVGDAWVKIDTGTRNGLAHIFNDAIANAVVTAAHATLPRIDQIVLQYNDSSIPAGVGGDIPTLRVLPGTPTSGATLDNRTGAAALPNDCLRLADVLVPAAATTVVTANIRDRRPWARGAFAFDPLTGQVGTGASGTVIKTLRLECSGPPVHVTMSGLLFASTGGATVLPLYGYRVDGAVVATRRSDAAQGNVPAGNTQSMQQIDDVYLPSAGSHVFTMTTEFAGDLVNYFWTRQSANAPFIVQELLTPNASN